jgi:hypothetical protein
MDRVESRPNPQLNSRLTVRYVQRWLWREAESFLYLPVCLNFLGKIIIWQELENLTKLLLVA